jgi:predicted AAA+ superfamily ATPase
MEATSRTILGLFFLANLETDSTIAGMIVKRRIAAELIEMLDSMPPATVSGPRQVGETTLVLSIGSIPRCTATARSRCAGGQ